MYRLLRCNNGLSRRLLGLCVVVCLLVTIVLWLRCDDTLTSSPPVTFTRSNKIISDSADEAEADDDEEIVDYDSLPAAGEVDRSTWRPAVVETRHKVPAWSSDSASVGYHEVECLINDENPIACRQDNDDGEVFVPFTFVSKYFEVYGKMAGDGSRFLFQHSYSRVYPVDQTYSPFGVFMSFDHYNVEVRDRVKCVSGVEGVPVSIQWGPQGYFYPTQIAQYALSHYSKYLKVGDTGESGGKPYVIDDAEDGSTSTWSVKGSAKMSNIIDEDVKSRVLKFHATESVSVESELTLTLPDIVPPYFYLSLDIRFVGNGTLTVVVMTSRRRLFRLHYTTSNSMLSVVSDTDIFYGIGVNRTSWSTVGRDVAVDLQKGIAHRYISRKKRPPKVTVRRIVQMELRGSGRIDNLTVAADSHLDKFFYGVDWLLRRQNRKTGGWPIPVGRSLADGRLTLEPGWYSAMAQGQAMSALVRAYGRTRLPEYIDAALRAIGPFEIRSTEPGGVTARFMGTHDWYEEYPTDPPCFVLNGFMYALVGLFDVAAAAPKDDQRQATAARLYAEGLRSLRTMLPLFDTGSGTVYDLRHLTLAAGGRAAPNRARWDYHATHINQLLVIVSILRRDGADASDLEAAAELEEVARRWTSYMKGRRAPHN